LLDRLADPLAEGFPRFERSDARFRNEVFAEMNRRIVRLDSRARSGAIDAGGFHVRFHSAMRRFVFADCLVPGTMGVAGESGGRHTAGFEEAVAGGIDEDVVNVGMAGVVVGALDQGDAVDSFHLIQKRRAPAAAGKLFRTDLPNDGPG
jgi:hypothetical protein